MFLERKMNNSMSSYSDKILQIKEKIRQADAVIIGAGAGLSTSAGFVYNGERYEYYFSDFEEKYGFSDMYSGGFYPYATLEEHWGYWSRYIYVNRYMNPPKPVYSDIFDLVKDKNYFVLTTNVDHCFQKAGFDKNRLFYTDKAGRYRVKVGGFIGTRSQMSEVRQTDEYESKIRQYFCAGCGLG